jgi:allantoin racemase
MRIRIIVPIIKEVFNDEVLKEASQFKAPDTELEVVNIQKGPASIESRYDDILASFSIVEAVKKAEKAGCDGVFIDCFGDPGVDASRELVRIPVVGGFQPAALTASLVSDRWSVVTVLKNLRPIVGELARKLGIEGNIASVRDIDTPVLELHDKKVLEERLLLQIEKAVSNDGAEAVVLGCTGMLGLAQKLAQQAEQKKMPIPVIDPTAAAIGYLELLIRARLSQSLLTYVLPPQKERRL